MLAYTTLDQHKLSRIYRLAAVPLLSLLVRNLIEGIAPVNDRHD